MAHLENELQRELHLASRPCGDWLTKAGVGLFAVRCEARGRVQRTELRVVPRIIEFASQLQSPDLRLQRKILQQRDVPVVRSRPAYHIFGRVPEGAFVRTAERIRVEEAGEGALALRQNG